MSDLIGYQERVEWMGTQVLTLAEVWPARPRAVIVGINPSLTSVAAGHYFQGQGARGRIMMLVKAGLMELKDGERQFERAALEAGIGFADLVRRPTPSATDLLGSEMEYGKNLSKRRWLGMRFRSSLLSMPRRSRRCWERRRSLATKAT